MSQAPVGEVVHDAVHDAAQAGSRPGAVSLLRRVHGLNGVVVLGGYSGLHVMQGWSAFASREAWVDRVSLYPLANGVTLAVLVGLVGHIVSGLALARQSTDDPTAAIQPAGALGMRRLQQTTGLVLFAFLVVHLVHTWPLTGNDPVRARDGYVALSQWLETPFGLAVYVVATTALAFHLAHGLARVAVSFGLLSSAGSLRVGRHMAGLFGIVVWCMLLHWVGHFANGVGVWPITGEDDPNPPASDSAPTEQEAGP